MARLLSSFGQRSAPRTTQLLAATHYHHERCHRLRVNDVSASGVSATSLIPLRSGTVLPLALELPHEEAPLWLLGEVTRCHSAGPLHRLGIQIRAGATAERDLLDEFCLAVRQTN